MNLFLIAYFPAHSNPELPELPRFGKGNCSAKNNEDSGPAKPRIFNENQERFRKPTSNFLKLVAAFGQAGGFEPA
jgi:hypothetical protein